jgi:DNA helicase-2/ATP-dependent DNA helicase PcrA
MTAGGAEPTIPAENSELLRTMTPAQRDAVLADDPVLCVVAGAGSGKTGVLTARVARRCADGTASAERSLVCTFSRKAAEELRNRLYRLGVGGVSAGTIHGLALRIVSESRDRFGGPAPLVLGDRRRLLAPLLGNDTRMMAAIETEIGWAKARLASPDTYEELALESRRTLRVPAAAIAEAYATYEAERRRRGVLDLDDLLHEAATAIGSDPGFAEALRWRSRHLYVDEMQDVNPAQFALLRAICGDRPDLFVVGDPDQSIYGWNGADPELLAHLADLFPGARVLRLDLNHRSSPAIVRCAEAVLGAAGRRRSARPDGPLPGLRRLGTDLAEAEWVARQVWLAHRPRRRWSHIAVLARTNAQLTAVATALGTQRIPCALASGELAPASDLGQPGEDGMVVGSPPGEGATDGPGDAVVLSTFHRAKGLQWPCVFVIGLSERFVPVPSARSAAALAEEQRLLYVALTRAEEELTCSWAAEDGAGRSNERCRWLALFEDERAVLEREQAPADPGSVASHLARLRSLVGGGAPTAAPVVPLRRAGRARR